MNLLGPGRSVGDVAGDEQSARGIAATWGLLLLVHSTGPLDPDG